MVVYKTKTRSWES